MKSHASVVQQLFLTGTLFYLLMLISKMWKMHEIALKAQITPDLYVPLIWTSFLVQNLVTFREN